MTLQRWILRFALSLLLVTFVCSMAVNVNTNGNVNTIGINESTEPQPVAVESSENAANSDQEADPVVDLGTDDGETGSGDSSSATEEDDSSTTETLTTEEESTGEGPETADGDGDADGGVAAEENTTTEELTTTTEEVTTTTTERVLTAEEIRLNAILEDTNTTIQSTKVQLYKQKTQLSLNFVNSVISLLENIRQNMTNLLNSASGSSITFANYKQADDNIEAQLKEVENVLDNNRLLLQKYLLAFQDTDNQLRAVHSTLGSLLLPGGQVGKDHSG